MRLGEVRTLDILSLILLAIALAALEIVLKEAPSRGWNSAFALQLLALSFASSVGFVRRTLSASLPIVYSKHFRRSKFHDRLRCSASSWGSACSAPSI